MIFSFGTFNLLANRFTNYNLAGTRNESYDLMNLRYLSIILILEESKKDILFLQEVDNYFYKLVMLSNLKNNYFITYRFHKAWPYEKNKADIGTIIMVKNNSFITNTNEIKNLNQSLINENPPKSKALDIRGGLSGIYDFIQLTQNGDEGNQRKFAHLLITKTKNNDYFFLINHHLEGRPDYEELRIKEFQQSYQYCLQFAKQFLKNKKIIYLISGDFNEDSQEVVVRKLIDHLPLKLINNDPNQITSFTKYSTDKLTNQRNIIDKQQKLDYLITSYNISLLSESILPKMILIDYPKWDIPFVGEKSDKLIINKKNWPSDHKLLEFILEIKNNHKSSSSIKNKKKKKK